MEHCKVCHQSFGGHSLGNAHRVRTGTYVLAAPSRRAKPVRLPSVEAVPRGWKILSEANVTYECRSVDDMLQLGWRLVDGVWRGPEGPAWWDKEDSENEPEAAVVDA